MATPKCNEKFEYACELAELLKKEAELIFHSLEEDSHGTSEQRKISKSRSKNGDLARSTERDTGRPQE